MNPEKLDAIIQFHGHFCPGLAIGIRAAQIAVQELGAHPGGEGLVALVETDMCMVDAIQFITGCTFGKGNLIHLDYGKNAYTFIRRSDNKAIRLVMKPQVFSDPDDPFAQLQARMKSGEASAEERASFPALFQQRGKEILGIPQEQLFEVSEVEAHIPAKARVRESIPCEACGEMVMETRARLMGGRKLCLPCFQVGAQNL